MTKEQAFQNLSLPADADIETIRMRFAARYTQSDAQYDRTLTEGMKALHERHLRELEQAYKVATDNPVIADMGALLSLGKGYVEENGGAIGNDDTLTTDEALAFFALYPHDHPDLAEQRYTQYVAELEEALEQVGLEASKEPYRREIARAQAALHIVINYLLASQMLASQQEEAEVPESETIPALEREDFDEPIYSMPTASKPAKKRYGWIIGAAIALLAIGIWIGKDSGTSGDSDQPDSSAQRQTAPASLAATHPSDHTAEAEIAETPTTVSQNMEDITTAEEAQPSPQEIVEDLLKKHTKGYDVAVTDGQIMLVGEQIYRLPVRNIDNINAQGEFVSVFGSSLYVDHKPKRTSEGLHLSNASQAEKDHLMAAIRQIAPARQPATTVPTSKPEIDKKEVVPVKIVTENVQPTVNEKTTAEPTDNKSAADEKSSPQQDTSEKIKPAAGAPQEKPARGNRESEENENHR